MMDKSSAGRQASQTFIFYLQTQKQKALCDSDHTYYSILYLITQYRQVRYLVSIQPISNFQIINRYSNNE